MITKYKDGKPVYANGHPVSAKCPAANHNTVHAARKGRPRCECPHGDVLYSEYLETRRVSAIEREKLAKARRPVPIPELVGDAARELLGGFAHPPHACVGEDPELWFSIIPREQELARAICGDCPVRDTCHQAAADNGWVGTWGATDEDDRRVERNSLIRAS